MINADALLRAVIQYGADEAGMKDRFGGNSELYELCFKEFLAAPDLQTLTDAVREKDYEKAFQAAHALKGLSGNLGLSAYCNAVCNLAESLRGKRYDAIEAEYDETAHELENLTRIYNGEQPKPAVPEHNEEKHKRERQKKEKPPRDKFLLGAIAAIFAVFVISLFAFYSVGNNYRDKTKYESGQQLLETGKQITMYLEDQIAKDWMTADSVSKSIARSNYTDDDETFLAIIREQREAWHLTDLLLYTANGYCVGSNGEAETNGFASDTLAHVRQYGSALSIIDSKITYTLPINTEQTLYGSKIVATSVVRHMDTLLDEMDFASYDNQAWVYLTEDNGVVISMLTSSGSEYSFNIETILDKYEITPLGKENSAGETFSSKSEVFFMSSGKDGKYLLSIPVSVDSSGTVHMRLFYIVPESVVNRSSDDFSTQLTVFSVIIIAVLVGLASLAFLAMYRNRKKKFDADLSAREQMFDLLIQNMRTVFGLFNTSKSEPTYISGNATDILGNKYWTVEKTEVGFQVRSESGRDTGMLRQANELLQKWDGTGMFRSGYLCDDTTVPPTYFELILYHVGETDNDMVGIIQDVTSAHEREEVTKTAMEMAKRSDAAKTRFLANMSHDIRTPMNAIMNMSRFAIESANDPHKRDEYLNTIYASSEHLLHLINDVLDMSRIDGGQTVIASLPFDLKAALRGQVDTIKPLCNEKHLMFIVELDGIHVEAVRGDSLKVMQVIMNLLSNAIKFTPEGGGVRFTAAELPSLRGDMVDIRFTVEDTGIGISQENLERIFEPFSRANDKRIGKIEGTGLGLSICKSYVEAMGGTITCVSEEGEGSKFTVELGFQKATIEKHEPTFDLNNNTPFLGMRCLVAEDIKTNQMIAKKLLERIGFIVDFADDGDDAVRKFRKSKAGAYDVIYMDIQMPIKDGYEATALIRQSEHPQASAIPIIAMTANVFMEDIEKARIAGMDGHIGKPIVSMELVEQTIKALEIRKER